ncbi:MAG: DoxX family protein [Actinomycetota bacterium]|jgi:putative oxidoreductase
MLTMTHLVHHYYPMLVTKVRPYNISLLVLRVFFGGMIFAHGYYKVFRGGKLQGTAGWFDSIGMRPGRLHATLAAGTELGAGLLLVLGFLTPLAAGALIALMVVAIITVHRPNGFFISNPGQGIEYCAMIIGGAFVAGIFGAGRYSLDFKTQPIHWLSTPTHRMYALLIIGFGGALLQVLAFYRPTKG